MITPMSLQDALCDFLDKEIAPKFNFNAGNGYRKPLVMRSGWIESDSIDDDGSGDFPFIMPRISKVEHVFVNDERLCVVTMMFIYGVFAPVVYDGDGARVRDGNGYRDFWNIVEATRQALFERLVIDGRFRIMENFFEAAMFAEQADPYREGYCLTKWYVPYLYPLINFNGDGGF